MEGLDGGPCNTEHHKCYLSVLHFCRLSLSLTVTTQQYTLADAGGFHGFHGTPLLRERELTPRGREIIVRMRASYSHYFPLKQDVCN